MNNKSNDITTELVVTIAHIAFMILCFAFFGFCVRIFIAAFEFGWRLI